jgi:hypothetical protein
MPKPAPLSTFDRQHLGQLFGNPETFATSLIAVLLDSYGTEFFDWEPLTIRYQVKDDFHADLHPLNEEKIMALIVALTTNQFQLSWEIFANTCRVLNGERANFSEFSPIDPEDIVWGLTEVLMNDPPNAENGTDQFSHEVARYIGLILSYNGVWQPPKMLSFAEMPFADPTLDLETAFVEDPRMFEAAQQNQKEKSKELELYAREKMRALVAQLDSLPLTNRQKYLAKPTNVVA